METRDERMGTNMRSMYAICLHAPPEMLKQKGPRLIVVSSVTGINGHGDGRRRSAICGVDVATKAPLCPIMVASCFRDEGRAVKIPRTHLLVLVSMCCLIAASVGLLANVQGLFLTPIADELGVLKGEASLTITISSLCGGLGGLLVPRAMRARRLRPLVVSLAVASGLSTAGLALCHSIVTIYLLCIIRGLASGMLGLVFATSVLNNWFRANIGLFTSLAIGTSGLAGSVFSPVFSHVIEGLGWRAAYLVMALCAVALVLPTILLVPAARPEDVRLAPFGEASARIPESARQAEQKEAVHVRPLVFALIVVYSMLVCGPSSMSQHLPGLAQSYGMAAGVGAAMLSAAMVTNTVGKVAFGALSDHVGARRSILLYALLVSCALSGMLVFRNAGMLIGLSALYGLTYSLSTISVALVTSEVCGRRSYAKVYPVATLASSSWYAVMSSVNGYVFDLTGGYATSIIMVITMLLLAAAAVTVAYGRGSARASEA